MRFLSVLGDALSFLTILPFPCPIVSGNPTLRMSRALAWFPLVGALVGWAGGSVTFLTVSWFPDSAASLLGLAAMVVLTGGLHLDGLADTVDGLGAQGGREETLKVMRDSRIGAFGALGLFLVLALKWAIIQAIPTHQIVRVLGVSCSLSRWAMVLCAQSFPYASGGSGLGRLVTDRRNRSAVGLASLLSIGLSIAWVGPFFGFLSLVTALVLMWAFGRWMTARLGGITGDTLGALNELVEVAVLLILARA
ncbi:MAG: adenosylcobinamide-GDP ribazoletransferase [Candidatus Omnitrophica bacterium]|nr:adenosylcobinamide-GDP ribazoletransferase [Candidatus Omnitrophota bacterium]